MTAERRLWSNLLAPTLALCLLVALFEAPGFWLGAPRPSGELVVLLSAYLASRKLARGGRVLRWLLAALTVFLVLYRIDRVVFLSFLSEEPLLYDQFFMLRHLYVLAGDLWSPEVAAMTAGGGGVIAVVVLSCRLLLGWLTRGLDAMPDRRVLGIISACWLLTLVGSIPALEYVRWITPGLIRNVAESQRIFWAVRAGVRDSPYHAYEKLELRTRPDVYLFLVESYGRFIADHPATAPAWRKRMASMQRELEQAGWHVVSGFSKAPIAGGRSWFAEASLLMGTLVRYESVFHHLIARIDRVPNLVGFLDAQGYETVLLAPADRARAGVEEVNYYNFDRVIRYHDLKYRGPRYGWGIIPDQYSLGFAHEQVLRDLDSPLFFNFHMVSSHAAWRKIPKLVDDWRSLNDVERKKKLRKERSWLGRRLKWHTERRDQFMFMGRYRKKYGRRYRKAIFYELDVIQRHLMENLPGDAIVIVMGDHQPPFLASQSRNFDVPVHIFARQPEHLAELKAQGFRPGMVIEAGAPRFRHEGLFSLLVRSLARCCGSGGPLPAYLPGGARLVDQQVPADPCDDDVFRP